MDTQSDISISTNIGQENEARQQENKKEEESEVIDSQYLDQVLVDEALTEEMQYLSQIISVKKPVEENEMVDMIIDLLNQTSHPRSTVIHVNNVSNTEQSPKTNISTHPYPPINQTGPIHDHDRPYAEYGHLGKHFSFNEKESEHDQN